jgi:RNA polymerase sigma factor (sigma-70 family)
MQIVKIRLGGRRLKNIILDNETKPMSFDEVYKQFEGLLHQRVRRWNLDIYKNNHDMSDFDDLLQMARMGLWKAYESYDSSLGYKFLTWATVRIDSELKIHHRDCHIRRLKVGNAAVTSVYSLNQLAPDVDDPDELLETIAVDDNVDSLIADIDMQNALADLTEEERDYIVENYLLDRNQSEIARAHGTYQAKVCKRIEAGLKNLRAIMAA